MKFRLWFAGDGVDPDYTLELKKGAEGWSVVRERIRTGDRWIEVDDSHSFEHPTELWGVKTYKPPLRATLRYLVYAFRNDSAARNAIEPLLQFNERFGEAWRYRPSAIDIANFVKHPTDPESLFYVRENGFGVAIELQALQGSDRKTFEAIENAVCQIFPHIKSIGFKTDWQGVRLTFNTDRSEDPIPAPQESDGVLLATFLFWRLFTGGRELKICLEEPENGLHPLLLADRFKILKKVATGAAGQPPCQILLATHSPEFLRAVKAHPTELWHELRLVQFSPTAGTSVTELSNYRQATKLIDKYLDEIHERWAPVVKGWS
jgi:predicted ATPase